MADRRELELRLGMRDRTQRGLRQFRRNARAAARDVQGQFRGVAASFTALRGGIAGVAGVIGAQGLVSGLNETAASIARIGDLSDRLGVTAEFLSEIEFAAQRTGVRVEGVGVALQRATRRLAEFRNTGRGQAAGAIEALGIGGLVQSGASIEQILPAIADGLARISDQGERVRLAFSLFDTEGVALVQTLQGGSRELEQLREVARRFGASIGGEEVERAKRYRQAIDALSESFSKLGREILLGIGAPETANFLATGLGGLAQLMSGVQSTAGMTAQLSELVREEQRLLARIQAASGGQAGRAGQGGLQISLNNLRQRIAALEAELGARGLAGGPGIPFVPEAPPGFIPGRENTPGVGPRGSLSGPPVPATEQLSFENRRKERIRETDDEMKKLNQTTRQTGIIGQAAAQGLSSAFSQWTSSIRSTNGALNITLSIVQGILTQVLGGLFGGGGLGGGLLGGLFQSSPSGGIGLFGADNGAVVRGPALIAQGNIDEAHIPLRNGRVPIEGGGGVTIINVQTPDAEGVSRVFRRGLELNPDMVSEVVVERLNSRNDLAAVLRNANARGG